MRPRRLAGRDGKDGKDGKVISVILLPHLTDRPVIHQRHILVLPVLPVL